MRESESELALLRRGNQADWDGRSAGAAYHRSHADVCRVVAAAGDVEYVDPDVARVGAAVDLIYECLQVSDNRDGSACRGEAAGGGARGVDNRNCHDGAAGRDKMPIL